MTDSQMRVLCAVQDMSFNFALDPDAIGIPLYKGEGRVVYAIAAYASLECWVMQEGTIKRLDSIVIPDTLPALFGKLSYWSHSL